MIKSEILTIHVNEYNLYNKTNYKTQNMFIKGIIYNPKH